jgi:hypothetical protein
MYDILSGKCGMSTDMAYRIARLADVSVDGVLSGKYVSAADCRYCGGTGKAAT